MSMTKVRLSLSVIQEILKFYMVLKLSLDSV